MRILTYRRAYLSDAPMLFSWRNDEATRAASVDSEVIRLEDHIDWLRRTIQSRNRKLYVFFHKDLPVGTVRFDDTTNGKVMSWTIDPERRGLGYGTDMVKQALAEIGERPIWAHIKTENKASKSIAKKAGFVFVNERQGMSLWSWG